MAAISERDMSAYAAGFRARMAAREKLRKEIEARAEEAVARVVERLRSRPGIRRIFLFGSLAKGTFQKGSDIDLAVEGLPAELHMRVAAELEREEDFDLDLQRWEELSEGFRSAIRSYGRILHEGT